MARFAPVAPIQLLEDMWRKSADIHGSYHLLLTHDVLESPEKTERFRKHFATVRKAYQDIGEDTTIIMDNSIVELGNAVDMGLVAKAGEVVNANVLVLPDVMGDGPATMKLLYETLKEPVGSEGPYEPQFMAVPQGPTLKEFAACLEMYNTYDFITWIGIPRIATVQLGSRRQLIDMAAMINPDWNLHLLGFSDNNIDDLINANLGIISGIDSAVPVRAGQKNTQFRLAKSDYGTREDYWESPSLTSVAEDNILYTRHLVGELA